MSSTALCVHADGTVPVEHDEAHDLLVSSEHHDVGALGDHRTVSFESAHLHRSVPDLVL